MILANIPTLSNPRSPACRSSGHAEDRKPATLEEDQMRRKDWAPALAGATMFAMLASAALAEALKDRGNDRRKEVIALSFNKQYDFG